MNPETRKEIYLDAILNGGNTPTPITREEMFLDAIAKNGTGGSSADLTNYYTKSQTNNLISGKVDKIDGKSLSTNDFTNEYKAKIDAAAPQDTTYTKGETDQRITAKVAEIISNAPEDFDTLKEISDWIETHEDSAAAMNAAIITNTTEISNLSIEVATVSDAATINRNTLGYQTKNMLKVTADSTTVNGVTMTVNSDGTLTLSGTASARTVIPITPMSNRNPISNLPTNFILSGGDQMLGAECCIGVEVSTGANSGYVASFYDGDTGRTVDLSDYPTAKYWYALVRIESGINVDGITIYPMIRDADISDSTYAPYSKPSVDERVSALEDSIVKLDSMDEFNALTDKTADWYFIKEG